MEDFDITYIGGIKGLNACIVHEMSDTRIQSDSCNILYILELFPGKSSWIRIWVLTLLWYAWKPRLHPEPTHPRQNCRTAWFLVLSWILSGQTCPVGLNVRLCHDQNTLESHTSRLELTIRHFWFLLRGARHCVRTATSKKVDDHKMIRSSQRPLWYLHRPITRVCDVSHQNNDVGHLTYLLTCCPTINDEFASNMKVP